MFRYLQGWKRKLGLAMLVSACCLAAGWAESTSLADVFRFRFLVATNIITSARSELRWDYYANRPEMWPIRGIIDRRRIPLTAPYGLDPSAATSEKKQFTCGVATICTGNIPQTAGASIQFVSCRAKYWFLVTLLAATSTSLVISKQSRPQTTKLAIELHPPSA